MYEIEAFVDLLQQHGNVGWIVLQIAIHRNNDVAGGRLNAGAHGCRLAEVAAKFDDLQNLFRSIIDKDYTKELYIKQFSLYIDNIVSRIDMQKEAYGKEPGISGKLFDILKEQKEGLLALKKTYGSVVTPSQLEEF